ncbi:ParB/RepB/Spo0J family partition protein [Gemelliphila palaticanis]|uniref:ParB/RepB/Spo0J family partition protein n=1 Tax=Gemelliphila palaticanis TaxID=81950 RepID=A0ABX2T0J4_9BACL|nr:ParB/RepB/Spo0J family partition protein [Gemella palaticanis]MBF0715972.1 ParB/RepB/Spo0J family partition protein [Gemella palaticanis]NYS47902.1 ParB/RepB/Spo0J family partition protein [Gemella palaticanis]
MVKGKGLGKGLGAIFQTENTAINDEDKVVNISLKSIKKNPYQPRTIFKEDKIEELANSIKNNGLLQPIVVKKSISGYYIVSGERRYRAFQYLEREEIPAIVKDITDNEMMVFAILENLQREDLSPLEEAVSYKNLLDSMNYTQEELAEQLGKSRPYVANSLRLLKLPLEIKNMLEDNSISVGHARVLLSLKSKITMIEVCNKVVKDNLSVRALEQYLSKLNEKPNKKIKPKDIFIEEQENKLKKKLGTQVVIKQSKNKKGKIEISFNDNDEFERIIKMFKG